MEGLIVIGYGARLKSLRLTSNLTMDTVSKAAGIAKSTYAGYESEFRQPSLEKLSFFADYYQVSTDYLLCLTNETKSIDKYTIENLLTESKNLHWDGIPLSEADMEELVVFLKKMMKHHSKTSDKQVQNG